MGNNAYSKSTQTRASRPSDGSTRRRARRPSSATQEPCLPGLDPEGAEERPRALLFGSPREVLARISVGDPLGIRDRVAICLRRERVLLDADRVHLRSLAHCAHRALRLRASEGLAGFLDRCIADAAHELLEADLGPRTQAAHRSSDRGSDGGRAAAPSGAFAALGAPLGLDPERVRAACAAFNGCAIEDRRACLEILVDGDSIDELAKRDGLSVSEVARRARRALDSVLGAGLGTNPKRRRSTGSTRGTRNLGGL